MKTPEPRPRSSRGKYITLAILLAWVMGVFIFTLFKFSGNVL